MATLAVIPARLASVRLPEKPLRMIAGKSLIERAWNSTKGAKSIDRLVVATDAVEIQRAVERFGGEVVMTPVECRCGSERVYAAAELLDPSEEAFDIVLNVQGDMPFLPRESIDLLVEFLKRRREFQMATIATPLLDEANFRALNVVKVVVSAKDEGFYFSRAPVPFPRSEEERGLVRWGEKRVHGFKHMGLYAFRRAGLAAYKTSESSPLEEIEKLEQLRVLERGNRIGVLIVSPELMQDSVEVDTEADLRRAELVARR